MNNHVGGLTRENSHLNINGCTMDASQSFLVTYRGQVYFGGIALPDSQWPLTTTQWLRFFALAGSSPSLRCFHGFLILLRLAGPASPASRTTAHRGGTSQPHKHLCLPACVGPAFWDLLARGQTWQPAPQWTATNLQHTTTPWPQNHWRGLTPPRHSNEAANWNLMAPDLRSGHSHCTYATLYML